MVEWKTGLPEREGLYLTIDAAKNIGIHLYTKQVNYYTRREYDFYDWEVSNWDADYVEGMCLAYKIEYWSEIPKELLESIPDVKKTI